MGFFRRLLNSLRPRARRANASDHYHLNEHQHPPARCVHYYQHYHGNRNNERSRYPPRVRTSATSDERSSMTSYERYPTTYKNQPSTTSTNQYHDGRFITTPPSAPLSRLSLSGISESASPIPSGSLHAPVSPSILINDEPQYDQERPNVYWTIPLPPVTPTQETSSVSNYQDEAVPTNLPQAISGNHEGLLPIAGNSTLFGSGSSAQGIVYEIPQYLQSVKNLKIEGAISVRRFLNILQYCSHLERLSVTINEDDFTHTVDFSGRVMAENLIDLSIITTVESKPLLNAFMAPNLRMFHLEWDCQNSLNPIPDNPDIGIDQLLKSSRCYLNTLSLVNLFPYEVQLVDCLKLELSKNLQTLIVRNNSTSTILSSSSGRVITEMTLKTLSQWPLCPRLSRLEITSCCAPDGQLQSMVMARKVEDDQTFKLYYSFGAGEGRSLHPIDRSELAKLSRQPNFTIVEGPQYCIGLN